jgi:nucleoside 2-deoxyribosyltransferase
MRLYLAAPWVDKDKMPERANQFLEVGHTITWQWWKTPDIKEDNQENHRELTIQANNDFNGVKDADILVLFNTAKSEGKAVEQGIALALGKPIIAIGKLGDGVAKNVFHYMRNYVWVESVHDALKFIEPIQWLVSNASRPE